VWVCVGVQVCCCEVRVKKVAKSPQKARRLTLTIEFDRESDGRWIAEVKEVPGVMCYGVGPYTSAVKAIGIATSVLNIKSDSLPRRKATQSSKTGKAKR
jgi:hypothetical protein